MPTGEAHVPGVDAVLAVHEPAGTGRGAQQVGQEQVHGVFHSPPARPGVQGQVVQEPIGQRAGPGRRPEIVHAELPGRPQPGGPDARAHGRTAAHGHDDGRRRRWRRWRRWSGGRGVRGGSGLVPGAAPRAVAHPQGAARDHGQAAQGRGGRGDNERLEVRGHGGRPHVPVHIHVLHGGRYHSGPHVRAPRDRHVIALPAPEPVLLQRAAASEARSPRNSARVNGRRRRKKL